MSTLQIVQLLFTLKAELAVLQKELLALQNASTSAVVSPAPIGFAPWVPPAAQPAYNQPVTNNQTTMPNQPIASEPVLGADAPIPSCVLTVTQSSDEPRNGNFSWTYQNIPDATQGQLFIGNLIGIGQGETKFVWSPLGAAVTASDKSYKEVHVDFQLSGHNQFKLQLGDATCTVNYTPPAI